jgi:hypothetical protein
MVRPDQARGGVGPQRERDARYRDICEGQGMKTIFEGRLSAKFEDGRQAMICEFIASHINALAVSNSDGCFFPRLQSWDERKEHATLSEFADAERIRVTIEIVS